MKLTEIFLNKLISLCKILYNCDNVLMCLQRLRANYDILKVFIDRAINETCKEAKIVDVNVCLDLLESEIDEQIKMIEKIEKAFTCLN